MYLSDFFLFLKMKYIKTHFDIDIPPTLEYRIAVGYQINVDLGFFPEINKRSLLNNCSLVKISRNE